MKLLVATSNPGKVKEIAAMVGERARVETLLDHPEVVMPEETGATFEENARLKAEHLATMTGEVAIADDSGLEVDALDGRPGVSSARYAPGPDAARNEKLLGELGESTSRSARFVCAMALAVPGGPTRVVRGTVEGRIGRSPRGGGGFGYDPIFELGDGRTMAELAVEEKNRISHRGRALSVLWPAIEATLSDRSSK
ncbi:MAG: RdgB/HAM1 family non-canonical purine NTP pyrophosphatase [Deltaproteobacteria bacterium]|nr:RdgB/HAM1 family non-canonical purine NTP pyrophosphatase [Deltaproteobacteria bacterium]